MFFQSFSKSYPAYENENYLVHYFDTLHTFGRRRANEDGNRIQKKINLKKFDQVFTFAGLLGLLNIKLSHSSSKFHPRVVLQCNRI